MFRNLLLEKVSSFVQLTPLQLDQLESHYNLLVRWNKTLNLSAVREEPEIVERHYAESLFLASYLPAGPHKLADIGSGPGFPGFPVAVWRPDCEVTLIESHQRKAAFLKEAARGLANVKVLAKRVEDVSGPYDAVMSRAVRVEDIAGSLARLSGSVFLLASLARPAAPDFDWQPPVPLPWSENGAVWIGERSVPRGT